MCFDASLGEDEEEVDETEEKLNEAVEWAMGADGIRISADGNRVSALDELELDEFAEHLRDEENARIGRETLEDIKAELCHPYRDTRGDCGARGPLEADRLFELLTGETDATLRPGSLVYVKYVRFEAGRQAGPHYTQGRMHVTLHSGLSGIIEEQRISDKWDRVPTIESSGPDGRSLQLPQLPIAEGTTISMKVASMFNPRHLPHGHIREAMPCPIEVLIRQHDSMLIHARAPCVHTGARGR
jgi:hypothetical protein